MFVLGLNAYHGDEFLPIIEHIARISILDPTDAIPVASIEGVRVEYREPLPSGDLPFPDGEFDLVLCFGVLHHIPNVSHVPKEIDRCLTCLCFAFAVVQFRSGGSPGCAAWSADGTEAPLSPGGDTAPVRPVERLLGLEQGGRPNTLNSEVLSIQKVSRAKVE